MIPKTEFLEPRDLLGSDEDERGIHRIVWLQVIKAQFKLAKAKRGIAGGRAGFCFDN